MFYSYVIVTHTDVHLFIDDTKLDKFVPEHFKNENLSVIIQPYDKLHAFFNDIVSVIGFNFCLILYIWMIMIKKYCVNHL